MLSAVSVSIFSLHRGGENLDTVTANSMSSRHVRWGLCGNLGASVVSRQSVEPRPLERPPTTTRGTHLTLPNPAISRGRGVSSVVPRDGWPLSRSLEPPVPAEDGSCHRGGRCSLARRPRGEQRLDVGPDLEVIRPLPTAFVGNARDIPEVGVSSQDRFIPFQGSCCNRGVAFPDTRTVVRSGQSLSEQSSRAP